MEARLDGHLNDLARIIGMETLRVVKGAPLPAEIAQREGRLPEYAQQRLAQLRAVADFSCEVDRAVSTGRAAQRRAAEHPALRFLGAPGRARWARGSR